MSLLHYNFESQYLNAFTDVNIILPDRPKERSAREFFESGKCYPVLWLLHGGNGDFSEWVRKTRIELYASENDLIVVMPSAQNSNYANYPIFGKGYDMYGYFFEELMPLVQNWLPASKERADNFISGLSMGGQGALKFALAHPERFAGCAVLSASPKDFPAYYYSSKAAGRELPYINLIDSMGGIDKFLSSRENIRGTLYRIAAENRREALPDILLEIGTNDHQYQYFQDFLKFAAETGYHFAVKQVPGYRHEWRFWDLAVQDALAFFGFQNFAENMTEGWSAGNGISRL